MEPNGFYETLILLLFYTYLGIPVPGDAGPTNGPADDELDSISFILRYPYTCGLFAYLPRAE